MRVFIGMETSGVLRRAFAAAGHDVLSCDLLPAQEDVLPILGVKSICTQNMYQAHIVGEVFEVLDNLWGKGWWPDLAIFHPECTYHTVSAAWAFKDPDYVRYPLVGYHQRVKPGTLVGAARRAARDRDTEFVKRIWALKIERMAIENPVGTLSTFFMKPTQVVQPWWFGDDASKGTCLWLRGLMPLRPTTPIAGRMEEWPRGSGIMKERWSNQTPSGQNKLTPSDDRWARRSDTFPNFGAAMVQQWAA